MFFKATPPPSLPAPSTTPSPAPPHSRTPGSGPPLRGVNSNSSNPPATLPPPPAQSLRPTPPPPPSHPQSAPSSTSLSSPAQVTPTRPGALASSTSASPVHPMKSLAPTPTPSSATPSPSHSSHPSLGLTPSYSVGDADGEMRRRKMLIHSTTTTIQSTSITEQGEPNISYYVHMNGGKGDDPTPPPSSTVKAHVSPVLHSTPYPDKGKERITAEGFTASRRKRAGAPPLSLEDGGGGKDGMGSSTTTSGHVKEHLLGHQTSWWWRVKERSRRMLSPFARLIGWKSFDTKKTDEDDGYFSASARKSIKGHQSPAMNGRKSSIDKNHAPPQNRCVRVLKALLVLAVVVASLSVISSMMGSSFGPSLPDWLKPGGWAPPAPAVDVAVLTPTGTPYTIISLLHDMNAQYEAEHRDGYIFQFNAIRSWLRLVPSTHIFLYMDTQESCDHLIGLVAAFKGIRCQPVPCVNDDYKRPRLDCLFNHANENAVTDIIAFVNGDIVLDPYLNAVLDTVYKKYDEHFSLVSRRTDTQIDLLTMDAWYASINDVDHTDAVIRYSAEHGGIHSEWGIDLFVYTRTVFASLDFPPFLAGVYRWDNWLLTTLILNDDINVVDATQKGLVIHQQSDVKGEEHSKRTGSDFNDRIVKQKVGSLYKIGHILNANTIIQGTCPDCTFTTNPNISLHVYLAKYQHPSMWVSIIPVSSTQLEEAYTAYCYYQKLNLTHYFFLARDDEAYRALHSKNLPVVSLNHIVPSTNLPTKTKQGLATLIEHEFFHQVLKLNYNFLYVDVGGLILTDPVDHLSTLEHDVMIKKQMIGTTVVNSEYSSAIYSIRSSTQAQFYWNQVKLCRQGNDGQPDVKLHVDCIVQQYQKVGGQLKKGFLDHFLFPDLGLALIDRWPQLNGYYPLVLVANATLSANPSYRHELLKQWKLTASTTDRPSECNIVHPPLFSPPVAVKQTEFSLKIRVLTFDRFSSLSRLLTSLNEANYDGDVNIQLEIAIDLPLNMSDVEVVEKNQKTVQLAQAFQWRHGSSEVMQQSSHKGLVGQWTTGWQPAPSNTEVLLVLEDDTAVSPHFYVWVKKMIQTYYLDPAQYDPRMYGFALQLQHTILGETLKERYGSRKVHDLVPAESPLFRYQLVGTWGGVFFPQHWREFVTWLREKQFQPASGTSNLPVPFKPCVPAVLSNDWWANKTHKVWSQWFIRFAYEKGWYNVYTNFPADPAQSSPAFDSNQTSLVGNYREAGDNFAASKGMMNPIVSTLTTEMMQMPALSSLPLYDFHFHRVLEPALLSLRNAIYNEAHVPQCWTMKEFIRKKKEQEEFERVQEDKRKLKAENKRRQGLGLKPLSSLAQLNPPPPPPPKPEKEVPKQELPMLKKSNPAANAARAKAAQPPPPPPPPAPPVVAPTPEVVVPVPAVAPPEPVVVPVAAPVAVPIPAPAPAAVPAAVPLAPAPVAPEVVVLTPVVEEAPAGGGALPEEGVLEGGAEAASEGGEEQPRESVTDEPPEPAGGE